VKKRLTAFGRRRNLSSILTCGFATTFKRSEKKKKKKTDRNQRDLKQWRRISSHRNKKISDILRTEPASWKARAGEIKVNQKVDGTC